MIISASYRTDIPAFHTAWLADCLEKGTVAVPNPYGGPASVVDLSPAAVSGWVFWTRNPRPLAPLLRRLAAPVVIQMTILDYDRALDRAVPQAEAQVAAFREFAQALGPRAMVWRYDPILWAEGIDHRQRFAGLARALAGATDEVVVSILHPYRRTRIGLARRGVVWREPSPAEVSDLVLDLASEAARHGMRLSLCSQPQHHTKEVAAHVAPARCIDAERLGVTAPTRGNRPGCLCAAARDIGRYDTCPHGCAYCYANRPVPARS
ncbi:MAG: DUF1848 family protein [Alphaproteobacteria bacterium]|nr:MAG: DUF1848 family protein [Alphaproteobacteria bacterium]